MTAVYEDLDLPSGDTPVPAEVRIRLAGAQGRPVLGKTISTNKAIIGESVLRIGAGINSAGLWTLDLWPNDDIAPAGTTWQITRKVGCDKFTSYISVPVTGGPYEAFTREDDPLGTITPSALAAHGSDFTLHGGGIEVDSAVITSPVTITGTGGGLTAAAVPGLLVTAPSVPRILHIWAIVPVLQTSGGPAEATYGIFPSGSLGAFAALDVANPPGLNTTLARRAILFAELPALTPGDYVVAGTGTSSNFTTRVNPSALAKARIWIEGA